MEQLLALLQPGRSRMRRIKARRRTYFCLCRISLVSWTVVVCTLELIRQQGYIRIVLAVGSLYFMPLHPRRCSFLYSISCLLDALDGLAARTFKQSTRFGAVLDMVTDRCATTCLLVFLATAKPAYSMIFQGLISLDFASHYMHMYATLALGGQGQSHKTVSQERSRIMHLYYNNKVGCIVVTWHKHADGDHSGYFSLAVL